MTDSRASSLDRDALDGCTSLGSDGTPVTFSPLGKGHRNISGMEFGKLKVVGYWGRRRGASLWWCRCTCGSLFRYSQGNLVCERSRGCRLCQTRGNRTHGQTGTPLHLLWIRHRSLMVPSWRDSFAEFAKGVGEKPGKQFLVRPDRLKPFGPGNFEWRENPQVKNLSLYEHEGVVLSAAEWAERLGISRQRFHQRLDAGQIGKRLFRKRGETMAEVLEGFQFKRSCNYPWDQWADGQIWKLKQGDDFEASPQTFSSHARKHAAKNNLRVRVRLFDDAVVLQFQKLVVNGNSQ